MTIRVLLGATSAMVRSALLGTLVDCEDIELVNPSSLDTASGGIDVVVLHRATLREMRAALRAIAAAPRIGVLAIGPDGTAGSLYRVNRERWRFAAGGRRGLADAIRAVAPAD